MKKSKLFVLLPMMALLLSGCQTEVVPSDAPSESPSEETSSEEYTPSVTYAVSITNSNEIASLTVGDSVVVAVSLITTTDGVDDTVNGTASDVTLSCDDPSVIGIEGLRITALNEGSTSIYASWTERGVTSSSVPIEVSTETVEPEPEPVIEYDISIDETGLSPLEVEDVVSVRILLITTTDGVSESRAPIEGDNVTLSSSNSTVLSVDGFSVTALEVGTATLTATWTDHGVSATASVIVNEKADTGGDTKPEEPEPEPVISYRVEITNAEELAQIEIPNEKLVDVKIYKLSDGAIVEGETEDGTSDTVTLISSDPDYLSVNGLTVKAEQPKEDIRLYAVWGDYISTGISVTTTSAPEPEPEPEPEPVYTYGLTVNNQSALLGLAIGYEHENVESVTLDLTLTTYKDGEYESSISADNTMSDLVVTPINSDIIDVNGLTITPKAEGETYVAIVWHNHPLTEGGYDITAFANVRVTEYFEPEPADILITSIGFSESTYEFVYGKTEPMDLDILIEPANATYPESYAITFETDNVAKINCEGKLEAVGIGTTMMFVTATDQESGSAPCGQAEVIVTQAINPITSFVATRTSIELEVGGSVTIGYEDTTGTNNPDSIVYANPSDADIMDFTLNGETDSYLSISQRSCDGLNTYTITALSPDDAGEAVHTYELSITADDPNSDAYLPIYVSIATEASKTNPVQKISLSQPVITITNDGSFTMGNDETSDITVMINDGYEAAYEDGWVISNYDSTYLSVDFDFESNTMKVSSLQHSLDYTVQTTVTVRSMGTPIRETELTVYILRAEDYVSDINVSPTSVSMLTSQSIVLGESDGYSDFEVSIYNQYREVLTEESWTASVKDSSYFNVISISKVNGTSDRLSITSNSTVGEAVIVIASESDPSVYKEINVDVSQQYYDVEQISCSETSIKLTYDKGSDPVGISATISDSSISYWNSNGPVAEEKKGFTIEYTGSYLSVNDKTITSLLPTGDEGVEVIIRSTSNTSVYTTITIIVEDITDYAVKTLSLVDCSSQDVDSIEISVSGTQDNSQTTLETLGVIVNIEPEYATNQDYSIASSNPNLVYVDDNNNITVKASKEDGSATLYVVASDDTYGASDSLTVNVTTTYVKADTITVNYSNTALTTGDVINFDTDSYVVVGNSASGTVTDSTYTITSSNESVLSVSGHEVSAAGAGTATLTFTTADGASVTTNTITVTDPRTEAKNVTVYFRLTDSTNSGTTYTCPDYADIYYGGNFSTGTDTWNESGALQAEVVDSVPYYKVTIDTILLDTDISYRILFEYKDHAFAWSHQSDLLTFKISDTDVADGGNLKIDAAIGDPANIIADQTGTEQFTVTIGFKNSGNGGSNNTIYIYGDPDGWYQDTASWSVSGTACTTASGNDSYNQYMTFDWDRYTNFKFAFGSSSTGVWEDWGVIGNLSGTVSWDSNHAYSWYSSPYWGFDLSNYSAGSLDSYTNLTIIFTLNFGNINADSNPTNLVTNVSISWS